MNTEQKLRAAELVSEWHTHYPEYVGDRMAALLQELVEAPEPEPVGYLYTNVQSGESHVSDTDDDYRGPESALWHIKPVYCRTKGQS